jgi:hypothetical protein
MGKSSGKALMVDVFWRKSGCQSLEKQITWFTRLSDAQAWTLIQRLRALLSEVDSSGYYQHDMTTQEQIEHQSVIDGVPSLGQK